MAENYNEDNIIHLDDREHIRRRPGMYIGKLGDGTHSDDGIYVLIKETIDNSIDEYRMGEGKVIDVTVADGRVTVRDYGRGIPLGKLVDAVSILNTGGMPVGGGKKGELPPRTAKVGTPVVTERGIALPVGAVPVEDFAKLVAHYVVEELVERITR